MRQTYRGVIVAAGRGSRMGSATQAEPKCLLRLAGKRLIEWQLAAFRAADIEDVAAIGGYGVAALRSYADVPFVNERWNETGVVSTLRCAREFLERGPCLVSYSDIVCAPSHLSALMASEDHIAITFDLDWLSLWSMRFEDPLSDAETLRHADGHLLDVGATAGSIEEIEGQFMGLIKFTPAGWTFVEEVLSELTLPEIASLDMTSLLRALLRRDVPVGAVPVRGGWVEADSPSDLEVYEARLREAERTNQRWLHDWREADR